MLPQKYLISLPLFQCKQHAYINHWSVDLPCHKQLTRTSVIRGGDSLKKNIKAGMRHRVHQKQFAARKDPICRRILTYAD